MCSCVPSHRYFSFPKTTHVLLTMSSYRLPPTKMNCHAVGNVQLLQFSLPWLCPAIDSAAITIATACSSLHYCCIIVVHCTTPLLTSPAIQQRAHLMCPIACGDCTCCRMHILAYSASLMFYHIMHPTTRSLPSLYRVHPPMSQTW